MATGVENLVIVDRNRYELNNLNRQILGWHKDIGRFKVVTAKKKDRSVEFKYKG